MATRLPFLHNVWWSQIVNSELSGYDYLRRPVQRLSRHPVSYIQLLRLYFGMWCTDTALVGLRTAFPQRKKHYRLIYVYDLLELFCHFLHRSQFAFRNFHLEDIIPAQFIYKFKKVTWLPVDVCVWGCMCVVMCLRASFTYFAEVLHCPHKRIVTVTKVYIARNNIHVEIIRFRKISAFIDIWNF